MSSNAEIAPKPKRAPYVPVTLSEEQQQKLEDEHEDILVLRGPSAISPWLFVVRRPNRQETIGYKQAAKRDQTTANEVLIRRITVFPKGDDLEKQLARWPFVPDGIADNEAFKEFVGIAVDESLKG